MRVYISADIEGVAGIVDGLQGNINNGGAEYEAGRRLMTAEVNAAIQGAVDAGATEIVVNDSHGQMRNLVPTELDPRARLIQGRLKPLFMAEGLNDSFAACFLVGYHGGPGSRYGVLNHAFHPYELRVNGRVWTETGLTAMVAGHYGVPTVLITGDTAAIKEGKEQVPGIHGVVVKEGISRVAADSVHPERARELIREGARAALAARGSIAPLVVSSPVRFEFETYFSPQADAIALMPTVERLGDRTVAFTAADPVTAYRNFVASYYINRAFA